MHCNGGPTRSLPDLAFPPGQLVDSFEFNPRYQFRDRLFLHQKYVAEGLSPEQIAAETFSSRKVIVKHLKGSGIVLRTKDRRKTGPLPFGVRRRQYRVMVDKRATLAIMRMRQLREQGLSYDRIAGVLNTMGIKTCSGRAQWYAKTVREVLLTG